MPIITTKPHWLSQSTPHPKIPVRLLLWVFSAHPNTVKNQLLPIWLAPCMCRHFVIFFCLYCWCFCCQLYFFSFFLLKKFPLQLRVIRAFRSTLEDLEDRRSIHSLRSLRSGQVSQLPSGSGLQHMTSLLYPNRGYKSQLASPLSMAPSIPSGMMDAKFIDEDEAPKPPKPSSETRI